MHGHTKKYNLYVAAVMPDHVHLILTPLIDFERRRIYPLYQILEQIKAFSARRIHERLSAGNALWQEESFDHVMRSSESLDAKIAYILANPVRGGLARVAEDYPWSWRKPRERENLV